MAGEERVKPKDFNQILRDAYRRAYGLNAGGGRPDQEVTGFAAGLLSAGVISVEGAVEALEEGVALAVKDNAALMRDIPSERLFGHFMFRHKL